MTERIRKSGGRYYKRPERRVPALDLMPEASKVLSALFPPPNDSPSVTTILNSLAKPALIGWAAKEERKMIAFLAGNLYEKLHQITNEPISKDKFIELLLEEAGKPANRQLLEKAANVGTEVHGRIEWEFRKELGLTHSPEPPKLTSAQAVRAFKRWVEWRTQVKLRPIMIEHRLFSQLFGFGGTLDLLAEIEIDGKKLTVVIDFKTGKAVYEESYLQNIAYRMALKEEGIDSDGGMIVRLPKYEDDPEFDAVSVPDDPNHATVFLALAIVYRWWVRGQEDKKKEKYKQAKNNK